MYQIVKAKMPAFLKAALYSAGFLTVLPVRLSGDFKYHSYMTGTFPLIGLLIGGVLAFSSNIMAHLQAPAVSAAIIVVIWIAITGGLHLDGLADTADGLASGFDKSKILKAMADHTNGTFAVIAIASVILLKTTLLAALAGTQFTALLMAPVFARWSIVLVMYLSKYPNKQGMARVFFEKINGYSFLSASAILLIACVAILTAKLIIANFIACLIITIAIFKYFELRIGGNTGDTLGATVEINEILVLLVFLVMR